jgi:hypothetical protein
VTQVGAPFFCKNCHRIVDPSGRISSGDGPAARTVPGDSPSHYVSRYESASPRDASTISGPQAVAGSALVGYLFAAGAGLILGGGLGWFGIHVFRLPVVVAFVVGWGIRRTLALGAGGGTPDRGLLGTLTLLGIVVLSFAALRYFEYRGLAGRAADRHSEMYGVSAAAALGDVDSALARLGGHPRDAQGRIVLTTDGAEVLVDEERERLVAARATGRTPGDAYDIDLLADTGHTGLSGHLRRSIARGETFRFTPRSEGFRLPGVGIGLLWLLEFGALWMMAFRPVD